MGGSLSLARTFSQSALRLVRVKAFPPFGRFSSRYRASVFLFSSPAFRVLSFPFLLAPERVRSRFTREWITAAYFSQLNGQHDIRTDGGLSRCFTAAQHSYQFAGSVRARWGEVGGRAKHPPSCAPIIIALFVGLRLKVSCIANLERFPLFSSHLSFQPPFCLRQFARFCVVRVIFFLPEISSCSNYFIDVVRSFLTCIYVFSYRGRDTLSSFILNKVSRREIATMCLDVAKCLVEE